MKGKLFILSLLLLSTSAKPQQPFSIKENYDRLQPLVKSRYHIQSLTTGDNYDQLGDGTSYVIASLLSLYQTTGDKAYLIKFINECIHIQSLRFDVTHPGDGDIGFPLWTQQDQDGPPPIYENVYHNGLIIWPMAKFYYLVKNDQVLANTNIPQLLIHTNNILGTIPLSTYGTFADWLKDKVDNTLTYLHEYYWNYGYGYKSAIGETKADIINKQSASASALLYLGMAGTNFYLGQAETIANLYKGYNYYFEDNVLNMNHVLELNIVHNSFQWSVDGWSGREPNRPEDMSHGAQTLLFPIAANETKTNSTDLFPDEVMVKFHNTFTKNLTVQSVPRSFHNNVYGNENYIANNIPYNSPIWHFKFMCMMYMPLHKFDDPNGPLSENTYNIIKEFYELHVDGKTLSDMDADAMQGAGGMIYGLSEVVKAQWEKECVNLTLNNRDVVYDQDFFVKNNLNVEPNPDNNYDPNVSAKQAFADPNNVDDSQSPDYFKKDEFIIESGITVNMKAGESIDFKSGFHAKAGCFFHAFIDPTVECTDGYRYGKPDSDSSRIEVNQETATQRTGNPKKENQEIASNRIRIFPNPTSGQLTIDNGQLTIEKIEVFNPLGERVYEESFSIQHSTSSIDLSSQSPGIYFVKVQTPENIFTQKLIIQN